MSIDHTFVRRPRHGYGWVDHRVVSGGHLLHLNQAEAALYLLLCVVANRHGISWYHPRTLARLIKHSPRAIEIALQHLQQKALIARMDRLVQVLDLPENEVSPRVLTSGPPQPVAAAESSDTCIEIRAQFESLDAADREELQVQARQELNRLLNGRSPSEKSIEDLAISYLGRRGSRDRIDP